jgi:outer membrane protein OmpA-like peptidoglycan-associated protein
MTDSTFTNGQFAMLYDVYFQFNESALQSEQPQLDSLVVFLKNNDSLQVEIGVHTDFRGEESHNMNISKERAVELCNYMTKRDINHDRISCLGFGESKPAIEFEEWEKIADTHRCSYYEKGNRRISVVLK